MSRDGAQLRLIDDGDPWREVKRQHRPARELADGHYSRQTPGADEFMANGSTFVLYLDNDRGRGVWGAIRNMVPGRAEVRLRCSIFRNESSYLSSDLIRLATPRTQMRFPPEPPLTTEIDPAKVRRKRDPGRCFRKAGWREVSIVNGLVVLQAPELAA